MPESPERQIASAMFPAELQAIGDHISGTFNDADPVTLLKPAGATHLKLQALGNNLRYRIDGVNPATATGFQLASQSDALIPCPEADIRIISEIGAGPTYQAQWVR